MNDEVRNIIDSEEDLPQVKSGDKIDLELFSGKKEVKEEKEESPVKKGPRYWTKEEWVDAGKDPDKYKSKEEFEKDGQFFQKIDEKNKTIKDLESKYKRLEAKIYQWEKQSHDNYVTDLKRKHFQAITEANAIDAYRIEEELYNVEEPESPEYEDYEDETVASVNKADQDFHERNSSWFENLDTMENIDMTRFAHQCVMQLAAPLKAGRISPEKATEIVENEVKRKYPHRFHDDEDGYDDTQEGYGSTKSEMRALKEEINELKDYPKVESNSYTKSRATARDIPKGFRDIYMSMPDEDRKLISPAEYIKSLKESGAI